MTVQELIDYLSTCEPNATVECFYGNYYLLQPEDITETEDTVRIG